MSTGESQPPPGGDGQEQAQRDGETAGPAPARGSRGVRRTRGSAGRRRPGGAAAEGPTFLAMIGVVAVVVAAVIIVFFVIGYLLGRLFL